MRCAKSWIWLAASGLLAGCNSAPVMPERVEVPVPVPCKVEMPQPPIACIPRDQGRAEWLRCALADCEAGKGYRAELEAALKGCLSR